MSDSLSRPPDERLLKLPEWAQGYIRDLEFEVEWQRLEAFGRQDLAMRACGVAIQQNGRRIKDAKPKGVLF